MGYADMRAEFEFEMQCVLAPSVVVGRTPSGLRRFSPLQSGTFSGSRLNGRVLPGGGDWLTVLEGDIASIDVRLLLETDEGVTIMMFNRGIRTGPPEVMAKIAQGQSVDPKSYYFRTVATFEAPADSQYEWLNRALFLCEAERLTSGVVTRFYRVM